MKTRPHRRLKTHTIKVECNMCPKTFMSPSTWDGIPVWRSCPKCREIKDRFVISAQCEGVSK